MPYALHIDVVPADGGKIAVEHVFYGHTEEECRAVFETHADGCAFLGPAIDEDRIEEELLKISDEEWPDYDDEEEEDEAEEESSTDEGELDT